MKNFANYIVGSLIWAILSSCQSIEIPKGVDCIVLTTSLFCTDTRIEEGLEGREFDIPFEKARGYRATPPDRYQVLETFVLDLAEEVEQLKRRGCDGDYTE